MLVDDFFKGEVNCGANCGAESNEGLFKSYEDSIEAER